MLSQLLPALCAVGAVAVCPGTSRSILIAGHELCVAGVGHFFAWFGCLRYIVYWT